MVIYDREARLILNKIKRLIKHYDIIKKGARKDEDIREGILSCAY